MYNIDDYDLKILTLLQANGRLTNQELSELIGLSASQCSRRRIALEQAQLILGYHARLAPDAAGQEMLGLIEVRLLNHTPQCVESFHQMLSEVDAILDAWKTTGDADYLLRVTVPDLRTEPFDQPYSGAKQRGGSSENRRRAQPPEGERPADAGHALAALNRSIVPCAGADAGPVNA